MNSTLELPVKEEIDEDECTDPATAKATLCTVWLAKKRCFF